jgi:hypothetical protein
MLRVALLIALATGCISKAKEAIAPAPDTVGTLSCREVVEQCDSQCGDPFCVNKCTNEGNQEAQGQHAALLDCGQRAGCTDQACMEQNCPNEIAACMNAATAPVPASAPAPDSSAPPAESGGAPGQTPPS